MTAAASIWEFNDRFDQRDEAQHSPLRAFRVSGGAAAP
jgi:hypothetical protein